MHWTNYRRLVNYLEQLPPEKFNYGVFIVRPRDVDSPCGCVAVCVASLTGEIETARDCWQDFDQFHIERFLQINDDEARYLFGDSVSFDPDAHAAYGLAHRGQGAEGIREALRRLAIVAARHGGEPSQLQSSTYQPDDQHFLASVRSLIDAPLVEVE